MRCANKNVVCIVINVIILIKLVSTARHFVHTKRELALIKNQYISQRACRRGEVPIFVHSAAKSSGKYYDRRQITRRTWVKDALRNNMRAIFVIGLPSDHRTQRELEYEARRYKDIIQFGFKDDYYNLTLKAMSILRWAYKNCRTGDIIVKTDDDVLLNIKRLKRMVDSKAFRSGITGRVMGTPANRAAGHKWEMPRHLYPRNYYLFMWGFSYILSTDVIGRMYNTVINSSPVLDIDDLYMTGIIAEKARIRRHDNKRFQSFCGRNACVLSSMLAIHGCDTSKQTYQLYYNWKNRCNPR